MRAWPGNILFGGGIGAIIDHNKGTAYTCPTWIPLIFGQTLVFDRSDEKEGQPVAGPGERRQRPSRIGLLFNPSGIAPARRAARRSGE